MKELLEKIDSLKEMLDSLSPMKPEFAQKLWEKFRLEWNYNSNHIEGNTLTYLETKALLIKELLPQEDNHTTREIDEMRAHDAAIMIVREWAADPDREISEADIRTLNRIILVKPFWKEAITPNGQEARREIKIGEYKEHPNHVQLSNGEIFRYAEPFEVPQRMEALLTWYRDACSKGLHPAIVSARLHYDFVCIHPFDDGNGRVARLLMNYHLLRAGFQPVIIKSDDKRNYFASLQRADVGDFEAFVKYIGEQMVWSLEIAIKAVRGENVEEEGDWQKQIDLLKRKYDAKLDHEQQNKLKEEQKKINEATDLKNWLNRNMPILLDELKLNIEIFFDFFEAKSVQWQIKTGNKISKIELLETSWEELAKLIIKNKFISSLMIIYNFSKLKQLPYNINYNFHVEISFQRHVKFTIRTSNPPKTETRNFQFSQDLDDTEFQIFREVRKNLFDKIDLMLGR